MVDRERKDHPPEEGSMKSASSSGVASNVGAGMRRRAAQIVIVLVL
jgi:hypothetical protein